MLTYARKRSACEDYRRSYKKLQKMDLDPIEHLGFMFDPSNPNVVGLIVGITMIAQPRCMNGGASRFLAFAPSTRSRKGQRRCLICGAVKLGQNKSPIICRLPPAKSSIMGVQIRLLPRLTSQTFATYRSVPHPARSSGRHKKTAPLLRVGSWI